jgi:hypothetical protein
MEFTEYSSAKDRTYKDVHFEPVDPLDGDIYCLNWIKKGTCKYGEQCLRASLHKDDLKPQVESDPDHCQGRFYSVVR